ncbi:MAG: TonB-dependent receptor plug domain-containing protein [Allosphingosinicella sp.]
MRSNWTAGVAGLCLMWGAPVLAQAAGPGGRTVYEAAFFAPFSPSNALEIVQRVPGFTLDAGDTEIRGFGQAAGNVVINGQRPSSKSDTLQTILARIPASRVARVEVGPGDPFGAEYAGKAQVLNLVLAQGGGLAGTVNAALRRDFTGRLYPEGGVSALVKSGRSSFNVAATFNNRTTAEEGYDTLKSLPGLALLEYRRKVNVIADPNGSLSGSWEHDGGANRTAHLNARFALDELSLTQSNHVVPAGGAERDDRLTERYHRREFEVGGDVTRPLAGGGLKLIGLVRRRHRDNHDLSLNRGAGGAPLLGGFAQDLEDQRDETVGRLVWSRADLGGWSVETGAEGVVNKLDSDVSLYQIAPDGARTRIDLPIDQAVVQEYRGEAFVNAGRPLSKTLRMDLGLTWEASRLTVSGDAEAERTLRFLKPKATFDWRPGHGWHAQLALARTVSQLQFEDFISNAELTNDRVNGGNALLVPQRAWESLLTLEHPILGDGLVKLEAGYNRVSLVQDRIPTPEGFDAPGNLGDGSLYLARATADLPLARAGIKGGRLSVYLSWVKDSVEDPYTHMDRLFSGSSEFVFDISFRQDLGKFAWGWEATGSTAVTFYRLDETDRNHGKLPYLTAFVEYRPDRKTTVSFNLDNATGIPAYRDRTFYEPSRRNPVPSFLEHRMRNRHIVPFLSVKRSF